MQQFCYNFSMSDIIKDPIQVAPGASTPPQPAKSNNTALIIVIVVVVLLFMLPVVFMFMLGLFIEKMINEADISYGHDQAYVVDLSEDQVATFQSIWVMTRDQNLAAKGVTRSDCNTIRSLAAKWDTTVNGVVGDPFQDYDFCVDGKMRVNATFDEEYDQYHYSFWLEDKDWCATFVIPEEYEYILSFRYGDDNVSVRNCADAIEIPVVADTVPDDGYKDDDKPFTDNNTQPSSGGTTKTNRI